MSLFLFSEMICFEGVRNDPIFYDLLQFIFVFTLKFESFNQFTSLIPFFSSTCSYSQYTVSSNFQALRLRCCSTRNIINELNVCGLKYNLNVYVHVLLLPYMLYGHPDCTILFNISLEHSIDDVTCSLIAHACDNVKAHSASRRLKQLHVAIQISSHKHAVSILILRLFYADVLAF